MIYRNGLIGIENWNIWNVPAWNKTGYNNIFYCTKNHDMIYHDFENKAFTDKNFTIVTHMSANFLRNSNVERMADLNVHWIRNWMIKFSLYGALEEDVAI